MLNYNEIRIVKKLKYGELFSDKDINKAFIPFYENQARIEVSFRNDKGIEYERKRGTIGITSGYNPCFLLMLTKRSTCSSYTIGKNDVILKVIKRGNII